MKDGEQDFPLDLIEAIEAWRIWFTRAIISACLIAALALLMRCTLLEPMSDLDYKIKANGVLKGELEI